MNLAKLLMARVATRVDELGGPVPMAEILVMALAVARDGGESVLVIPYAVSGNSFVTFDFTDSDDSSIDFGADE